MDQLLKLQAAMRVFKSRAEENLQLSGSLEPVPSLELGVRHCVSL